MKFNFLQFDVLNVKIQAQEAKTNAVLVSVPHLTVLLLQLLVVLLCRGELLGRQEVGPLVLLRHGELLGHQEVVHLGRCDRFRYQICTGQFSSELSSVKTFFTSVSPKKSNDELYYYLARLENSRL